MKVKCPGCGKTTEYSTENSSRPFCSERCQLIDLGAWADEKYAVPLGSTNADDASVNEYSEEQMQFNEAPPPKHLLN